MMINVTNMSTDRRSSDPVPTLAADLLNSNKLQEKSETLR